MTFTFGKTERLCSKKLIASLFQKGNRGFSLFPFRVLWKSNTAYQPYPVQVLITVPKRNFPKPSGRNRVKRQIKELYRHRKHELYQLLSSQNKQVSLLLSYQHKQELPFEELRSQFDKMFQKLLHELQKDRQSSVPVTDQDL